LLTKKVSEPSFYHTTIKEWPIEDRPRERLISHGASALTDAELLAILIRTGVRGSTAIDLAKKLLSDERTLTDLAGMSTAQFYNLGIGQSKAASLLAAFELGRRMTGQVQTERIRIESPQDVLRIMKRHLHALNHEEFWVLHLNAGNRLISKKCVTVGILNSSLVHPRECFAEALVEHSAAVIFVHNHPSGNSEPSQEDISITRQLVQSGEILGIKVHDHVVIAGESSYTSFAERNLL
jgi:DNA repair protein RadC